MSDTIFMGGFGWSGGSGWAIGQWSVGQWMVGDISFQKIYGLYGILDLKSTYTGEKVRCHACARTHRLKEM